MFTREAIASANATLKTMDIKSKSYVPVSEKVKALRLISPKASISTEIIQENETGLLLRAIVADEDCNIIATGHAYEEKNSSQINQANMLENCETSAIGRALENIGIGLPVKTKGSTLAEVNSAIKTIDIKGKAYPEVSERIAAFRTLYPAGRIETNVTGIDGDKVTFIAYVYDEEGNILASGRASELKTKNGINALNHIENCETSAIGRALSFAGFGITVSLASAEEMRYAELMFVPATEEQLEQIKACEAKSPENVVNAIWNNYCPSRQDLDSFNAGKMLQTYDNYFEQEKAKRNANDTLMSAANNYK